MRPVTPPDSFDPARLEEAFLNVRPRLKSILAFQRIPPEDAEDLIQEALIAAIVRWDSIVDLEAWLFGALRFRCSIYRRSRRVLRRRLSWLSPLMLDSIVESETPPQEREDMMREIYRASVHLGRQHQTILRMRYLLGFSVTEIAARLGYRPASIRKLSTRAISRVRKQLDLIPVPEPE